MCAKKNDKVEKVTKDEALKMKTDAEMSILQEKLVHAQTTISELKSDLKSKTLESGLLRVLSDELKSKPITSQFKPISVKTKDKKGKEVIEESAVLILSDLHGDQEIPAHRVNGLENYNFNVFCRRMERLVDVTIDHCKVNMANNYNFSTLYVLLLGDLTSGEIHGSAQHSRYKNSLKNSVAIGEVIGMALKDLSDNFEKVIVLGLVGNHGRRNSGGHGGYGADKKCHRSPHDSFDYLCMSQAYTKVESIIESGKIEFVCPESYSALIEIEGHIVHASHGDDVRSFNGIPFYGLERYSRRLMSLTASLPDKKPPSYFFCGHFHTSSNLNIVNNTELVIGGAFTATDEYALSMGLMNQPKQTLMGFHPKYGKTWSMPIHLRPPVDNWMEEESKPGRYQVKILGD